MASFFSLLVLVLAFLALGAESTLTPSEHSCLNSSRPNTTSSYWANLKLVLDSLASNSRSQTGYYNASSGNSPDVVYGSFLCKGDLTADECEECVGNITKTILQICPKSEGAILWYDQCMIRYSDHNFFSSMETEPYLHGNNNENVSEPEKFMAVLETTMRKVVNTILQVYTRAEKKYATDEAKIAAQETLYTMAQCSPDMNVTGCRNCLKLADSRLQTDGKGKIGARILFPDCFMRFEIYPFYRTAGKAKKKFPTTKVALIASATVVFVVVCVLGCFLMHKKRKKGQNHIQEDPTVETEMSELHALQFPLCMIEAATNNFSSDNKLGEGGFGPVYKGKLPMGQEIAAKRLSQGSGQGVEEFKNEIELVAKLQHKNLVRLLGFSLERDETILVYEYVSNGSLDHILFDPKNSGILDWSRRYKIMVGVARGLLYLHEDSRLKIIHRDLKASNILLDDDMNPKISDFGTARIFCADQIEASTNRIVGTYGYMSPEYIMFGNFSTKSDVFSFGVLVLEIITGKKNSSFQPQGFEEGLLGFVWKHWSEGIPSELVDPAIGKSYLVNELIRCIHIGLLCVQDDVEDRPTMDTVVLMLNTDSVSLPLPHRPSFFFPSRKHKQPVASLALDPTTEKLSETEGPPHTEPGPR